MLLAPMHRAILPKLKIMCASPLVMRAAPAALGGLGLHSLEITSGIQAIQHLISLFTSYTPSKLLLITTIEYHQLEIGTETLFLNSSFSSLSPLATSTWFAHLWEFLHLYKLEINLPALSLLSTSCGNDSSLTALLISLGWKSYKMRLANQTRIWLQIYFASDLLLIGANNIKRCLLQGKKDASTSSKFQWPIVQVNAECIAVWKSALSEISTGNGCFYQSI